MNMSFEKDYFIQSEKSNYEDYRDKKFDTLANDLLRIIVLDSDAKILDFGCATGGLLSSLKQRGYTRLKGTDISYWAVSYGKKYLGLEQELEYHNVDLLTRDFDLILFLDVLEHVPSVSEIIQFLKLVRKGTRIIVRVPISVKEGEPYMYEVSRNDATHVQCHDAKWWDELIGQCGYMEEIKIVGKAIYESEGVFARCYRRII